MSIGEYGVNYPADVSVTKGSNDMSAHVQSDGGELPEHQAGARRLLAGGCCG